MAASQMKPTTTNGDAVNAIAFLVADEASSTTRLVLPVNGGKSAGGRYELREDRGNEPAGRALEVIVAFTQGAKLK